MAENNEEWHRTLKRSAEASDKSWWTTLFFRSFLDGQVVTDFT